jgi:serine/threonine protein kinase
MFSSTSFKRLRRPSSESNSIKDLTVQSGTQYLPTSTPHLLRRTQQECSTTSEILTSNTIKPSTRPPRTLLHATSFVHQSGSGANNNNNNYTIETLLTGHMYKRGHFFKNWRPRYFILTRSSLCYYKSNPHEGISEKEFTNMEKKLLKKELLRNDVIKVEAVETFKSHPFCFVVSVIKRRRRYGLLKAGHYHAATSMHYQKQQQQQHILSQHHYSNSSIARKQSQQQAQHQNTSDDIVLYYIQANREEEREKWIKTITKWLDRETPVKLGHEILQYILNNEYFHYRYEQKVCEMTGDSSGITCGTLTPAEQAGRKIEEEYPVLANLMRDMHECRHEDEMIYILDQVLGEVKEGAGAYSTYVKKMIAAAGEDRFEHSPDVWTEHVKLAYGKIMKTLSAQVSISLAGATKSTKSKCMLAPSKIIGTSTSNLHGDHVSEFSFHKYYKFGRKLGSGAFSVVHTATHRDTRKQVAVKCIAKAGLSEAEVIALKQEVEIMAHLDHPNLVPLLDYYEEEKYYYIVTPLCTGGELFDALVKRKSYTEDDARLVMKKLASAIAYIHSLGIVHRDLKPENILLKTSAPGAEIMIADFGFARPLKGSRPGTACGTPGYVAPEVVKGQPYGSEVDCWSLGVIFYILLCGYPPFPGNNHAIILEKVVHADYKFDSPSWDEVSDEAKDLVRKLLDVNRETRLTANGILNHPWINPDLHGKLEGDNDSFIGRSNSNLHAVLHQMRKHSLTHNKHRALHSTASSSSSKESLDLDEMADLDLEMLNRELQHVEDEANILDEDETQEDEEEKYE